MTGQDEMARVEAPGRCTPSEGPPVERPMHPGRDEMEFELNKWSGFALVLAALLVAPVAGAQEQTESEEDTVQTITDAVAAEAVDDGGDAEAADGEPGEEDCDDDAPPPVPQERCLDTVDEDTGQPLRYAPARIDLNDEGTQWIRFITWLQIWARAQELNPGTRVDGSPQSENFDIGVRRARFLVFGQVIPRVRILFHAGMNNQSFVTGLRPDFYIHDAWTDFEVIPDGILWLGGGLHYWNGLSRHANASTLNFLGMDAPISNWFTIERTDQFARQMGLFAHGQIEGFDYRIALNRPFTPPLTLGNATGPTDPGGVDYRRDANTFSVAGYFQYQFLDHEGQALPYTVGTYLGSKTVFNIGAGFYWQEDALGRDTDPDENVLGLESFDQYALGIDAFLDIPTGEGGAVTAYAHYAYHDFGPGFVRNVGIMNVGGDLDATAMGSFNGAGNAYPLIGTGHTVYAQGGFLLPVTILTRLQIQPYFSTQISAFDALDDPMIMLEGGVNWLILGHHARITTHYRARPLYSSNTDGTVTFSTYASEGILQLHIFF